MGGLNKREHLIRTGQEMIWSKGYDRCSIKDITGAAGLPKGSFYHYFESKEKFALEAMKEYIETYEETLPSGKDGMEALSKMIDARISAMVKLRWTRECYMSVMCHAFSEQEQSFRHEVLAAIDHSNAAMHKLITEMHAQGLIRQDLKVDELMEFIDFAWRGARLKSRIERVSQPLLIYKKYLLMLIQPG